MKIYKQLQKSSIWTLIVVVLAMAGVLLLASCAIGEQQATKTEAPKTQTSVQFSWVHTIEFVGFYEAIRQGYYTDANLDVRLDGGGFDDKGAYIDPVGQVVDGKSDFGIAGADVLLAARAQGKPVVAIASIYQRSPVVLISLAAKNIVRPKDLVGQRVDTQPGTTVGLTYQALLASQEVDRTKIIETPRSDFTVNPLFEDKIDVLSGFITNDGVQAKLRGEPLNLILMSDYGINLYSNVIFTTEDMIKNKPELVEAFVEATAKGMQWAIDYPEQAAKYVVDQYGESMVPDIKNSQEAGLLASIPLIKPAGSQPGMMQAQAWETAHQILLDQGILNQPLDIKGAYNLTFLEKIYNRQAANQ
jgi:ABC-type nitrate/sulfonate/bicarbonate transport system substrate-binding protein